MTRHRRPRGRSAHAFARPALQLIPLRSGLLMLVLAGLVLLLTSACANDGASDSTTEGDATNRHANHDSNGGGPGSGIGTEGSDIDGDAEPVELVVTSVATGLRTPWALAFAPDGRLFVTEREGRVRVITEDGLRPVPLAHIEVTETDEGGLMGIAVDPDFPDRPYLYVMYTFDGLDGLENRIDRIELDGEIVRDRVAILEGLPAGDLHNGGRLRFGPDGMLYATLGDTGQPSLAQDAESPAGKILRLEPDGGVPGDNPFEGSHVYSLGHRNPQGLAWDADGQLWATDHGDAGNDEVNRIVPGGNYGWPDVEGQEHGDYEAPAAVYSPAIAPAGAVFVEGDAVPHWNGRLLVATLAGRHLHVLDVASAAEDGEASAERMWEGDFGRLRDVTLGPDGAIYATTSNYDGRGEPGPDDDRVLRIGPAEQLTLLYPDLRTHEMRELMLDQQWINGADGVRWVLRFTNLIVNEGEGPLELRAVDGEEDRVYQRIYTRDRQFVERYAGSFTWHPAHNHWHFESLSFFELWHREDFEVWEASGRSEGEPGWVENKTSTCLLDSFPVLEREFTPPNGVYPGDCTAMVQGISAGWGDIYEYWLPDQWVVIGGAPLEDGEYVLRSIADPRNLLHESPGGRDPEIESEEANEAILYFEVRGGAIFEGELISAAPSMQE